MQLRFSAALLALLCTGASAQIFGPPALIEPSAAAVQPAAPAMPARPQTTHGPRSAPAPATDFRSVAMACANTGKESKEAFDACMKSSTISQPGVPKAMQEARLVPSQGPVYTSPSTPSTPSSTSEPGNLFATPEKKFP